jgi:hypothetical protein
MPWFVLWCPSAHTGFQIFVQKFEIALATLRHNFIIIIIHHGQ